MSRIAVTGNPLGTGTFTIASPNSNSDRTLNLPDAAGTIQVSGNPISGTTGTFTGLVNISAAGAGQIQFPATQNASANANTLDDYEEGTFTPALTGYSGTTYGTRLGIYTKVGNIVTLQIYIDITVIGTFGSNTRVTGLPFSPSTTVTDAVGSQPTIFTALNATRDDQYLAIYDGSVDLFAYSNTGAAYNGNNWKAGQIAATLVYRTA